MGIQNKGLGGLLLLLLGWPIGALAMYFLVSVMQTLREHQLLVKPQKCSFAQHEIQYLGHIISAQGVSANPGKISNMVSWSKPTSLKRLQGFLGLIGYYRKFIKNNGTISVPLTKLLKKGCFEWSMEADVAFAKLKTALTSTPVLTLPDFTHPFSIECDTSDFGIGGVLTQDGCPIAFTSKGLVERHRGLSTYEKEMMAILHAVGKWRSYLLGRHFTIVINRSSQHQVYG
ncbi:hypothetical protein HHK36_017393 [Tetracentron sinense]|uniref:Reverse transcriptase/retrotransposon-derived protein RNase H-like domain-containing protein n=1 Tax=Tetracentron sinense TaxID=13715 RepID=A0A834Z191_TETSI|nr:hypothetical protein HHK36_017393 [Tetracentron sinense]